MLCVGFFTIHWVSCCLISCKYAMLRTKFELCMRLLSNKRSNQNRLLLYFSTGHTMGYDIFGKTQLKWATFMIHFGLFRDTKVVHIFLYLIHPVLVLWIDALNQCKFHFVCSVKKQTSNWGAHRTSHDGIIGYNNFSPFQTKDSRHFRFFHLFRITCECGIPC